MTRFASCTLRPTFVALYIALTFFGLKFVSTNVRTHTSKSVYAGILISSNIYGCF